MIFSILMECLAADYGSNTNTRQLTNNNTSTNYTSGIISGSEINKDAYTDCFELSNGEKLLAIYEKPVNYMDEQGNWKNYNNTMELTDTETISESDDLTEGEYKTKDSDFSISLSKKSNKQNMVKASYNGFDISWGLIECNKTNIGFVDNSSDNQTQEKNELALDNLQQKAVYQQVYEGVDVEYIIDTNSIKENFILQNKDTQNEFTIQYKSKDITAVAKDEKTIEFRNKSNNDETVYVLNAPIMIDSLGKISDSLTMSIIEQKNNSFSIELIADKEWITCEERQFPITIDPELEIECNTTNSDSCTIYSKRPDNRMYHSTNEYIGYHSNFYTTRAIYKLTQLPALERGDYITSAKLQLGTSQPSDDMNVYLHSITTDNDVSASTWNNSQFDEKIIDYDNVKSDGTDSELTFDITRLVRSWYKDSSKNLGVILESDESISSYVATGSGVHYYSEYRPVFLLTYKSYTGNEDTLTYQTHQIGEKVTSSVSTSLVNLIISQNIFEGTGSRLPISISVLYNSILKDEVINYGSTNIYGFQFSFNQYIEEASQSLKEVGYDYIYYNDSGGKIYFKLNPNKSDEWIDEDDSEYILTKDDNYIYISDYSDIIIKFALPKNGGCILSETDSLNNTILYGYDSSGNVTSITDGAGRIYAISNTTNLATNTTHISSITAPDGKTVNFSYSTAQENKERLTSISYPGGITNYFTYSTDGNITQIQQSDNSKITYSYTDDKVVQIKEYGTDGTEGNYLNISYNDNNTTTLTDRKGRSETHTFNNAGETIYIINDSGYIVSTSNSMSLSSSAEDFTKNYITNSNAESLNNYSIKQWNTSNTGIFSLAKSSTKFDGETEYYLGNSSLKISQTNSGDFTTFYQNVNTMEFAGEKVTFSAYLKTNDIEKLSSKGVCTRAVYLDSQGEEISTEDGKIYSGTRKWQRICQTFNVPENATVMQIHCGIKNTTGTAWFDCMQLEKGECMNNYNAIENYDCSDNTYWQGGKVITGSSTQALSTSQEVIINKANPVFVLSGSASADSLPLRDNRQFGIKLSIYYQDGIVEEHTQSFNECSSSLQAVSITVLPENYNKIVNKVVFGFIYDYNTNIMTINKAMLNVDLLSSEIAVGDSEEESTKEATEETDNEIDTTPYQGYVYSYDNFDNVTQSNYGTVLTNSEGKESLDTSKQYISTNTTYNISGNYPISESDERGNFVTYNVDDSNGKINSITDANSNIINYTYDSNTGSLTSISSGTMVNTYSYDSGNKLTVISHNGFDYNFNYDKFNQISSVYVGDTALMTNSYEANNGNIINSAYGNGDNISYVYDEYDRVIAINNNDGIIVEYFYNKKGLIAKIKDYSASITTEYIYDIWGSAVTIETSGTDNNTLYYSETTEDGNTSYISKINNDIKTVTYRTDENGNSIIDNDGWTVAQNTDNLNRTSTVTVTPSEDNRTPITTSYTYVDIGNSNRTTNLIESITYTQGNTVLVKYSYEYDSMGNIIKVYENNQLTEQYTYDINNQLHSVSDYRISKYTLYTYDSGNNIYSTNEQYMNSIGITSGKPKGETYYYDDANWKDKLTSYGADDITYDEIGNPLNYRDGMTMTWQNGRELKELVVNDELVVEYKYNANGLRTLKSLYDGVDYYNYYYDENNNLIALYDHYGKMMQFYYGADGTLVSMRHKGKMYYYIRNLQGDITKLIEGDGTVVATYTYNAWGKILSIKDADGNVITSDTHVALINPFRYRGYVYDDESGLYYLQSRYYDPTTGRFVNADVYTDTQTGKTLSVNMFAYCENNYINAIDKTGNFVYFFSWKFMDYCISTALNLRNYENNSKYNFNRCIINQKTDPKVRKIYMGLYTGDYNGCGWIATYNALRLLKCYTIQPKNIITYFERQDQLLYSAFGVMPWVIENYFSYIGYSVQGEYLPGNINQKAKKYRVCILMYAHSNGAHYIAITYRKDNRKYYAYNVFSDSTNFLKWSNIDYELKSRRGYTYLYCLYIR